VPLPLIWWAQHTSSPPSSHHLVRLASLIRITQRPATPPHPLHTGGHVPPPSAAPHYLRRAALRQATSACCGSPGRAPRRPTHPRCPTVHAILSELRSKAMPPSAPSTELQSEPRDEEPVLSDCGVIAPEPHASPAVGSPAGRAAPPEARQRGSWTRPQRRAMPPPSLFSVAPRYSCRARTDGRGIGARPALTPSHVGVLFDRCVDDDWIPLPHGSSWRWEEGSGACGVAKVQRERK
jgi:hypothetical protein